MKNRVGEKKSARFSAAYNPNRFNALDSGICYIIVLVAFYLVSLAMSGLFGEQLRALYKFDVYAYLVVSLLVSQITIFAVALVYSLVRKTNPFCGGGYVAKFDAVQFLMSFVLIMGLMMTLYHSHLQFGKDAETILGEGFVPDTNLSAFSGIFALLYIILTVVCPAVFEEMLFRGIIMRGLEQFGSVAAIVLSSVAFALMHGNFSQLILQFAGGVAIASVVTITGNYLIGCAMHGFNNLYSVFYGVLIQNLEPDLTGTYIQAVTDAALILIGVAFLTISIIYFAKLALEKKKKEWEGKPFSGRFDKVRYYEMTENGETKRIPHYVKAETKLRGEEDERLFLISKKERPLNRKSSFFASCAVFGVAILVAILFVFI